ncbi:kinase-like domain-containing protein, partial [Mycena capillaripes]
CREALVWWTLRHEYVLPLIGIDRETFPLSFCMVSPWLKHGTILKYLNDHGRADVEKMASLLQIVEGLAYLHSMKVVHGDLRGTNILVSDSLNTCLADFGLTGVIEDTISTTSGALMSTANHAGSLRWFAPELVVPTLFGCERFVRTPASDVYAFACVCLELYTGRPPFSDISPDVAVMLKVIAGERPIRPAAMSDNLWELVTAAWAQNFGDRPDLGAIIESLRRSHALYLRPTPLWLHCFDWTPTTLTPSPAVLLGRSYLRVDFLPVTKRMGITHTDKECPFLPRMDVSHPAPPLGLLMYSVADSLASPGIELRIPVEQEGRRHRCPNPPGGAGY